ncbi:MAG: hypothetical protein U0350_12140 [Caldilineaceae bacterium]
MLALFLPIAKAQAHGGAIIKDGYTDKYEWLVAINPYPTPPGQTVITILVYSLETHKAVNGLQAELYLAPPGSSSPCCEKGKSLGPFPLNTDPTQFPGDYSTQLALDKTGAWQAKFHMTDKSGSFDVIVPLAVTPGGSNQATLDAVMAQVASGQIAVTPQPQSPLTMTLNGQPVSPLVTSNVVSPTASVANNNVLGGQSAPLSASQSNPFGRFWWLWGLFAIIPIGAIFVWGLRPV